MATPSSQDAAKQAHLLSVKQQVYRVLTNLVAALASSVGGPIKAIEIIEKEAKVLHADLDRAHEKAARRARKGDSREG